MLFLMLGVFSLGTSSFDSPNSNLDSSQVSLDRVSFEASELTDLKLDSSIIMLDCNEVAAAGWQEAVNAGISDNETLNTIFEVQYFYCENFLNPL
jgi:hypothetical protein